MKHYLLLSVCLICMLSCSKDNENEETTIDPDDTVIVVDSKPGTVIPSKGYYVINEDWFGHDKGTVNYFKTDGSIDYRAYSKANANERFGVTTCFATIYGDNFYFVSKQGLRLVVADAKTLVKKAQIEDLKGDGRSFLGLNENKAYVGTLQGVSVLDIKTFTITSTLQGISGQVGNMNLIANKAFVLVQTKGVYVVNTLNDSIESLIEGSFNCMTQSKDGSIWIGSSTQLIQVNPYNLKRTDTDITATPIGGSWGAWHAGGLCASTARNVLYWRTGAKVIQYDIDTKLLNVMFYALANDENNKQLAFYGAGLRVNPLTDQLILNLKKAGWGTNGMFNWNYSILPNGKEDKVTVVTGGDGISEGNKDNNYYWFPAMPVFEDANGPEILLNQIILKPNERKAICLSDKIVDADNMSTAIIKQIESKKDQLIECSIQNDSLIIKALVQSGKTKLKLKANSNGQIVSKEIRVDIRK